MSEVVANYDYASGGPLEGRALELARGLMHWRAASWPYRDAVLDDAGDAEVTNRDQDGEEGAIFAEYDGAGRVAVALVTVYQGTLRVRAYADGPERAERVIAQARERFVPDIDSPVDQVPVSFWAYGNHGPFSVRRELDAPLWEPIHENYAEGTRAALARLMTEDFEPGRGGQLILWHGEPGTGKTTALRALAQSWRKWSRLHYITDPEKFFGSHADYMLQVMLQEDAYLAAPDDPDPERELWRLLVLEDAGELLRRDARQEIGQALSRFLNAVDGLIGQGLRVLTLATTNEDLGNWHPAVMRHGRAMAEIEFTKLSVGESADWLERNEVGVEAPAEPQLLADLYAMAEHRLHREPERLVGFARG